MKNNNIEFSDNISLYDSKLLRLNIYERDYIVFIEAILQIEYPSTIFIKLVFEDVVNYSLCWNNNHYFYTIDSYKLIFSNNLIYCSFDPFDDSFIISSEDLDVIESTKLQVYCASNINFENFREINLC